MTPEQYLTSILLPLCKNDFRIDRHNDEMGVLLELHAGQEDMGSLIGRGGITINAIRLLPKQFGFRQNPPMRLSVKIMEPPGSRFANYTRTATTTGNNSTEIPERFNI